MPFRSEWEQIPAAGFQALFESLPKGAINVGITLNSSNAAAAWSAA